MKSIIKEILEKDTNLKNEIINEYFPIVPKTPEEIQSEIKSYTEFASWNVKGEMLKTHGSNKLLKMNFKPIKFTDIKHGLKEVIFNFKKFSC